MGNNCCGPEHPDASDNRDDVMREYTPGIMSKPRRKPGPQHQHSLDDFLMPSKRNATATKASATGKGWRQYRPKDDDPYRLDTVTAENLNRLVRLQSQMNEDHFIRPEDAMMGMTASTTHGNSAKSCHSSEAESTGSMYVKKATEKSHFAKSRKQRRK